MKGYPIAETFTSVQGEGVWSGVQMTFLRVAGCNVGEPYTAAAARPVDSLTPVLPILASDYPQHTICQSALGQRFLCDTDYTRSQFLDPAELAELVTVTRACITGGEPFLYDLEPLIIAATYRGIQVHIETSGTKPIPPRIPPMVAWIACSPKVGYLPSNTGVINEFKFVISAHDELTDRDIVQQIRAIADPEKVPVYLQPANDVTTLNAASVERCLRVLRLHPALRLSVQLHKLLGVQ